MIEHPNSVRNIILWPYKDTNNLLFLITRSTDWLSIVADFGRSLVIVKK